MLVVSAPVEASLSAESWLVAKTEQASFGCAAAFVVSTLEEVSGPEEALAVERGAAVPVFVAVAA